MYSLTLRNDHSTKTFSVPNTRVLILPQLVCVNEWTKQMLKHDNTKNNVNFILTHSRQQPTKNWLQIFHEWLIYLAKTEKHLMTLIEIKRKNWFNLIKYRINLFCSKNICNRTLLLMKKLINLLIKSYRYYVNRCNRHQKYNFIVCNENVK